MEGPSIVIAKEEFKRFEKQKIINVRGSAKIPLDRLKNSKLLKVRTWGKHLILEFSNLTLRIHFLMFGSYRINDPRENRIPKLELIYKNDHIYFYSCAIKVLEDGYESDYDWSVDLMSDQWNAKNALPKMKTLPDSEVCDLLLDQTIFSGLGNIMKNEILFKVRLLPRVKVKDLSTVRLRELVKESQKYAWQFYEWKKLNVLKRNWKIMRKKICPVCSHKVTKAVTGKLKRMSHFCRVCQLGQ